MSPSLSVFPLSTDQQMTDVDCRAAELGAADRGNPLRRHLQQMVRIVIKNEENQSGVSSEQDEGGSVLAFVLENSILGHWCSAGKSDAPRGMRALALWGVHQVLSHSRHPGLMHKETVVRVADLVHSASAPAHSSRPAEEAAASTASRQRALHAGAVATRRSLVVLLDWVWSLATVQPLVLDSIREAAKQVSPGSAESGGDDALWLEGILHGVGCLDDTCSSISLRCLESLVHLPALDCWWRSNVEQLVAAVTASNVAAWQVAMQPAIPATMLQTVDDLSVGGCLQHPAVLRLSKALSFAFCHLHRMDESWIEAASVLRSAVWADFLQGCVLSALIGSSERGWVCFLLQLVLTQLAASGSHGGSVAWLHAACLTELVRQEGLGVVVDSLLAPDETHRLLGTQCLTTILAQTHTVLASTLPAPKLPAQLVSLPGKDAREQLSAMTARHQGTLWEITQQAEPPEQDDGRRTRLLRELLAEEDSEDEGGKSSGEAQAAPALPALEAVQPVTLGKAGSHVQRVLTRAVRAWSTNPSACNLALTGAVSCALAWPPSAAFMLGFKRLDGGEAPSQQCALHGALNDAWAGLLTDARLTAEGVGMTVFRAALLAVKLRSGCVGDAAEVVCEADEAVVAMAESDLHGHSQADVAAALAEHGEQLLNCILLDAASKEWVQAVHDS